MCDVISFLLLLLFLFCAQRLKEESRETEREKERHLTGVNYLPPLSIREKERMMKKKEEHRIEVGKYLTRLTSINISSKNDKFSLLLLLLSSTFADRH